ncbi:alpha/beta hydrolase [Alloscardovia theropitheci]|uniref:Alpha/beta hydrolase n=1 Tax=Alloscardovia theropitheci TaxID=2496842 RepID=A0A4R0QQ02_9BIFI|nr:alpha/beta hydrolase [Alloscardovia theropitheci]TCD54352.1 alpha/beta hydrolase [Alloscardovia theropitheci]
MQLDERAAEFGVTFLDDTTDESYFMGMKGVHAILDAFMSEGWLEPAGPQDVETTDFRGMKVAPHPRSAHNGEGLHYVHIDAKYPRENTPSIVMLNGFTETVEHMIEIAYYFWQAGYDIYIPEHRGHGLSPRDVDDLGVIWIDDYRRYVADVEKLIQSVVRPHAQQAFGDKAPVYVYGHSMGGGIAIALAEHAPSLVDKYVLTCPMVAPRSTLPDWLTKVVASVGAIFKSKSRIYPSRKQLEFNTIFDENYARGLNHGRALWLHEHRCAVETSQMYAPSYGWLKAAINLTQYIRRPENESRITSDILMFYVENDAWVSTEQQEAFYKEVNELAESNGRPAPVTAYKMPHSRHEMEAEKTEVVHEMVDTILDFLGYRAD